MRKIMIVHWEDAWSAQNEVSHPGTPVPLINIGFLVDESDGGITIASECAPDDHEPNYLRHFVFIPWVNVTKIEELVDV